jgi:hypothetical protein
VPVAFYGRTARAASTGDSAADRHRQLALCRAAAAACGGQVTAEFFDEACRADDPWHRRPHGQALLAALCAPDRVAATVVVADPWCLLPRRLAPDGTAILAQLKFRRVRLVLADSRMAISTAAEYALLGRLLTGSADGTPPRCSTSWPAVRGLRARGGQPSAPAAGLSLRSGEPR